VFRPGFALRQVMGNIANEPRPPDRGTADHHRIARGLRKHRRRVREARAIAIRDHRYRNSFLDRADRSQSALDA